MLLYGLQWFVISVPSIIILGAITAEMNNSDMSAQILYMQKLFALIGFGLIGNVVIDNESTHNTPNNNEVFDVLSLEEDFHIEIL